ncbi:glycosyltransferase [Candidatus Woesearchaeota archaeon]|nr:glycosyltransferase [Candidatus Woesearchaeota archaeon]
MTENEMIMAIKLILLNIQIRLTEFFEDIKTGLSNLWIYLKPSLIELGSNAKMLFSDFLDTFVKKAIVLYEAIIQYDFLFAFLSAILAIGTINWAIWLMRRARSTFYRPYKEKFQATTSVIIPVYKEKKYTLKDTIDSIIRNNPNEIILIFDHTEKSLMKFVQENYKNNTKVKAHFIDLPGKRPALAKGIKLAQHEIVVLVDSDTQWKTEHFLENLIAPFKDPRVGGTGSRQKVKLKETWAQKIIDWNLDLKYSDYVPSDSLSGSVLCLSGRTAAYRRKIILPVLHKLTHEYFLWHRCLGGDDTRLTSLVLQQGYRTIYQDNAVAEAEFHPSLLVYLKQKIRWSRNSFRAYLKAIFSPWPWKQERWQYLIAAYHTIAPGITALIGFAFFIYALVIQEYSFVYFWLAWIFVSRLIKGYSHIVRHPKEVYLLPAIVLYYFLLSFVKLYAFLTITVESWSGSRNNYTIKRGKRVVYKNPLSI